MGDYSVYYDFPDYYDNQRIFSSNSREVNGVRVGDDIYISYLGLYNGIKNNFIAKTSLSNTDEFEITQLTFDNSTHQNLCHLYTDSDDDIICFTRYNETRFNWFYNDGMGWDLELRDFIPEDMWLANDINEGYVFDFRYGYDDELYLFTMNESETGTREQLLRYNYLNFSSGGTYTYDVKNMGYAFEPPMWSFTMERFFEIDFSEYTNTETINKSYLGYHKYFGNKKGYKLLNTSKNWTGFDSGSWQSPGFNFDYVASNDYIYRIYLFSYHNRVEYESIDYGWTNTSLDGSKIFEGNSPVNHRWILSDDIQFPYLSLVHKKDTFNLYGLYYSNGDYLDDKLYYITVNETNPYERAENESDPNYPYSGVLNNTLALQNEILLLEDVEISSLGYPIAERKFNQSSFVTDDFLIVPVVVNDLYNSSSKIYLFVHDVSSDDVSFSYVEEEETGLEAECELSPFIDSVSRSNDNPVCWNYGNDVAVDFDVTPLFEDCEDYYNFWGCKDCEENYKGGLGFNNEFVDMCYPDDSDDGSTKGWEDGTNIPIIYISPEYESGESFACNLNETSDEISACVLTTDTYPSCQGLDFAHNVIYSIDYQDYNSTTQNTFEFRSRSQSTELKQRIKLNATSSGICQYHAYYNGQWNLLGNIGNCTFHEVTLVNAPNAYFLFIEKDFSGTYDITYDYIPYTNDFDNIASIGFYQENTQLTDNSNKFSYIYVDLSNSIDEEIPEGYNQYTNPVRLTYSEIGNYSTKICVENPLIDLESSKCSNQNVEVVYCTEAELREEGIETIGRDTEFKDGDVAFNFIQFLEDDLNMKSTGSKYVIAIFIIICVGVLGFVLTKGNYIVSGICAFLSLFLCVFLGLIPIWVLVMFMILSSALIGLMFIKGS